LGLKGRRGGEETGEGIEVWSIGCEEKVRIKSLKIYKSY
jgi:hypothetical protein